MLCFVKCSLYKIRNCCYLKSFSEMPKNIFDIFIFSCLSLWSLNGVFGVDKVKSVSVMEGDSVTLHTDDTEIQRDEEIDWRFGHSNIIIAKIYGNDINSRFYDDHADGRFRDRLKVNHQIGSLTITNTRTTDSGLYTVTSSKTQTPLNIFSLTVYAHLPVPVISRDSPQNPSSSSSSSGSSTSKCSLLCSVVNVSHVTLSWYKGNTVFSSISVFDLGRNLSLHLECLDDSYSCVVNNPISNQTQHLNSTELCQPCSEHCICCCGFTEALIRSALSALVGVATLAILVYDIKSRSFQQNRKEKITPSNSD